MFDGAPLVLPPGPTALTEAKNDPLGSGATTAWISTLIVPATAAGLPRSSDAAGCAVAGSAPAVNMSSR